MTAIGSVDKKTEIKETINYDSFKKLGGNRPVNETHVTRPVKSMRQEVLFSPIAVNSKMEIVDGQHRFEARKRLNLPIPYFVVGNYGLNEVQKLNAQQKKWSVDDYLQSNILQGNKEYEIYEWFRRTYGFAHNETLALLCDDFNGRELGQAFNLGLFRCKNLSKAKETAEKFIQIRQYYPGYQRRSFVRALLILMERKNFEFSTFLRKLEIQPTALKHCATIDQYIDLIEQIYNFQNRNKVSLRYSE